jgi:hypothetical protein
MPGICPSYSGMVKDLNPINIVVEFHASICSATLKRFLQKVTMVTYAMKVESKFTTISAQIRTYRTSAYKSANMHIRDINI